MAVLRWSTCPSPYRTCGQGQWGLAGVQSRIDDLEKSPAAAPGLVVLTEAAEELCEIKVEAEYLAALAA
jgi:hypothetical protein